MLVRLLTKPYLSHTSVSLISLGFWSFCEISDVPRSCETQSSFGVLNRFLLCQNVSLVKANIFISTNTRVLGHVQLFEVGESAGTLLEDFDDTKGVIRIRNSMTPQWLKEKGQLRTNNDLQNITQKTKDQSNTNSTNNRG